MGNRTVWIVLAVVAAAVLLCCCVLVVGIAVYGLAATSSGVREVTVGRVQERTEQRFAVDDAPVVEVVTFAGDVTLRAGSGGEVDVVVTKKAGGSTQLDRISVTVSETQDGVRIEATAPRSAGGYRSVDVDVTVPSDAQLALETGAGNIGVVDVAGSIIVLLASIPAALWVGAKLFRVGLLIYGKRPTVKEIWGIVTSRG